MSRRVHRFHNSCNGCVGEFEFRALNSLGRELAHYLCAASHVCATSEHEELLLPARRSRDLETDCARMHMCSPRLRVVPLDSPRFNYAVSAIAVRRRRLHPNKPERHRAAQRHRQPVDELPSISEPESCCGFTGNCVRYGWPATEVSGA